MSARQRISRAFDGALRLSLDENSRYILLSDCHRGTGSAGDNFLKNEYLYLAALKHYFQEGFTYLELGDGDELWENRSIHKIKEIHGLSFAMIAQYYQAGRFHAVYGNHDIVKKRFSYVQKNFDSWYCQQSYPHSLCPDITFYSGIILEDAQKNRDIYLTHGHQADILNSMLWPLARFLVRYVWRPLEKLGIPDPTSAAKNNTKKEKSERLLTRWAADNDCILITGHTHRPMIGTKDAPYCNTGSCIHPSGITGIEIENRCMTLVKWSVGTKDDMSLYAMRETLGETICIDNFAASERDGLQT